MSLDEVVGTFAAGVHEFIEADGVRLSGGQRQRLAIARAIYRHPDLLLLDEATSGLDEATEALLLGNLKRERPAMSVVFTTHRTSNLRFADQIVLVDADSSSFSNISCPSDEPPIPRRPSDHSRLAVPYGIRPRTAPGVGSMNSPRRTASTS